MQTTFTGLSVNAIIRKFVTQVIEAFAKTIPLPAPWGLLLPALAYVTYRPIPPPPGRLTRLTLAGQRCCRCSRYWSHPHCHWLEIQQGEQQSQWPERAAANLECRCRCASKAVEPHDPVGHSKWLSPEKRSRTTLARQSKHAG